MEFWQYHGQKEQFSYASDIFSGVIFSKRKTDLRRNFNELESFYLINAWASFEDSQEPDFDKPADECNELFGYDAWVFTKDLVFIGIYWHISYII